jgi:RimJ/RimL family protein N-acetyltransferase
MAVGLCSADLTLRSATSQDWQVLLAWRNDAQTRASSRHADVVEEGQHRAWLAAVLDDDRRQLLVAECEGRPAGTVRLDRVGNGTEISWTVGPEWRRRGIGRRMAVLAMQRVPGYVFARMRRDNTASERIAQALGMHVEARDRHWVRYSLRKSAQGPEDSRQ